MNDARSPNGSKGVLKELRQALRMVDSAAGIIRFESVCLAYRVDIEERCFAQVLREGLIRLRHVDVSPPISRHGSGESVEGAELRTITEEGVTESEVVVCLGEDDFDGRAGFGAIVGIKTVFTLVSKNSARGCTVVGEGPVDLIRVSKGRLITIAIMSLTPFFAVSIRLSL